MIAHTVQRPLEQLVERLLLCHACFLCSVSSLDRRFCVVLRYQILKYAWTLSHVLLISTTFYSASRRHPLTVSHATASKRQQISARARAKWDTLMVKSKPRDSSNFTLHRVPASHPSPPQYLYPQSPCSGRLWLWYTICQVGTRHLGVVLGNSTIRRLGDQRRLFSSRIITIHPAS